MFIFSLCLSIRFIIVATTPYEPATVSPAVTTELLGFVFSKVLVDNQQFQPRSFQFGSLTFMLSMNYPGGGGEGGLELAVSYDVCLLLLAIARNKV